MITNQQDKGTGISRRDYLKLSGLVVGGLATVGASARYGAGNPNAPVNSCYPTNYKMDRYSYFDGLRPFTPGTPLDPNEMRITFLGSEIPPVRRATEEMSVFVEVGWIKDPVTGQYRAEDQFVFDCGSGVCSNYAAMQIGYDRMDKVFLCHLHGDHMSDLSHIYCFGPSGGRYSPLYVWGPGPSGLAWQEPYGSGPNPPNTYGPYDDGLTTYCQMLRAAMRWHSESFSFLSTSYQSYTPPTAEEWGIPIPAPVQDPRAAYNARYQKADYIDSPSDAYALVPIELDWTKKGDIDPATGQPDNIAYDNKATRVKITHFPVVHCRRGSMGYKLEWTTPQGKVLSMMYTSDTRPETISINQASNNVDPATGKPKAVDVFIHEMVVPADVWALKQLGLDAPPSPSDPNYAAYYNATQQVQVVQDSSHTPQGAFGYLLSQISPRPRLAVACHFPVADDTVACAFNSVLQHCTDLGKLGEKLTWAFDLMVIKVTADTIQQLRGVVSDFSIAQHYQVRSDANSPKYWRWGGMPGQKVADPIAQIDEANVIQPGDDTYRPDGY